MSADRKCKSWTCWRVPCVSCIGVGVQRWWCAFQLGTFSSTMGTGDNSGCTLCGSGCVRLSAGLSCGWWDCRTGGTRNRTGDHHSLVIAFDLWWLGANRLWLSDRTLALLVCMLVSIREAVVLFPLGCGNSLTLSVSLHTLCSKELNCLFVCVPLWKRTSEDVEEGRKG